jgi:hypothetical protein
MRHGSSGLSNSNRHRRQGIGKVLTYQFLDDRLDEILDRRFDERFLRGRRLERNN